MNTTQNKKQAETSPADNQKIVDNHKKIASHLEEAAKHHKEAAKHHEEGNREKAAHSTLSAHGHQCFANECQKEDAKRHAESN